MEERHRGGGYFPIDLVAEILARLPVKSLLRFRCVCKAWRSLILDPTFIHSHRRRSRRKPPLILVETSWLMPGDTFTVYSLTNEDTLEEYFKSPDLSCNAIVIASSPDLLLLRQDRLDPRGCFFLLNPSTRQRLILPESESQNSMGDCGFGLDYVPSLGRFKVARFFSTQAGSGCEVLVVGADRSWRPAKDPPFAMECSSPAPLVDGAIHMLSLSLSPDPDADPDWAIAAFDLRREIWRVIQLPPGFSFLGRIPAFRKFKALSELRGSLYLSRFSPGKLETWVLKDYENGNWMMQYSIDILRLWNICDIETWTKVYPVVIEDDGNILIIIVSSTGILLFRYHTTEKVFTLIEPVRPPCLYAENCLPLN